MTTPSITVVNCGSAFSLVSTRRRSYSVAQLRAGGWIVADCTPSQGSSTSSGEGRRVVPRRRRRLVTASPAMVTLKGRMPVSASCSTAVMGRCPLLESGGRRGPAVRRADHQRKPERSAPSGTRRPSSRPSLRLQGRGPARLWLRCAVEATRSVVGRRIQSSCGAADHGAFRHARPARRGTHDTGATSGHRSRVAAVPEATTVPGPPREVFFCPAPGLRLPRENSAKGRSPP
jgi:hypothetical protein